MEGEMIVSLNKIIMNKALRGNTDCTGPAVIYWRAMQPFLFVFIEECTGSFFYRIFIIQDSFRYEQKRVMYPAESAEDLQFVYGYYQNIYGTEGELLRFVRGDWCCRIKEILPDCERSHKWLL